VKVKESIEVIFNTIKYFLIYVFMIMKKERLHCCDFYVQEMCSIRLKTLMSRAGVLE